MGIADLHTASSLCRPRRKPNRDCDGVARAARVGDIQSVSAWNEAGPPRRDKRESYPVKTSDSKPKWGSRTRGRRKTDHVPRQEATSLEGNRLADGDGGWSGGNDWLSGRSGYYGYDSLRRDAAPDPQCGERIRGRLRRGNGYGRSGDRSDSIVYAYSCGAAHTPVERCRLTLVDG